MWLRICTSLRRSSIIHFWSSILFTYTKWSWPTKRLKYDTVDQLRSHSLQSRFNSKSFFNTDSMLSCLECYLWIFCSQSHLSFWAHSERSVSHFISTSMLCLKRLPISILELDRRRWTCNYWPILSNKLDNQQYHYNIWWRSKNKMYSNRN